MTDRPIVVSPPNGVPPAQPQPAVRAGPPPPAPREEPAPPRERPPERDGGLDVDSLGGAEVAALEDAYLRGVLDAARQVRDETRRIVVARHGRPAFHFEVRGLTAEERDTAERKFVTYDKNAAGFKIPDVQRSQTALQRCAVVYAATTDAYRRKLWDNPTVQQAVLDRNPAAQATGGSADLDRYRRAVRTVEGLLYDHELGDVIEAIDTMGTEPQDAVDLGKG